MTTDPAVNVDYARRVAGLSAAILSGVAVCVGVLVLAVPIAREQRLWFMLLTVATAAPLWTVYAFLWRARHAEHSPRQ